jgi:hypothetical protein
VGHPATVSTVWLERSATAAGLLIAGRGKLGCGIGGLGASADRSRGGGSKVMLGAIAVRSSGRRAGGNCTVMLELKVTDAVGSMRA